MVKRIRTGIKGLDGIIKGGVPKRSITLVSGSPGTGKTIFGFQFIWEGIQNGEKCLYVTLDNKKSNLIEEAEQLGFKFSGEDNLHMVHLDMENENMYEDLKDEILGENYSRIVLDSLSDIVEAPSVLSEIGSSTKLSKVFGKVVPVPMDVSLVTRMHVHEVISILRKTDATSVVTSELPKSTDGLSRDTISEFLADAVILLSLDKTLDKRHLEVRKMRKTEHTLKPQEFKIGKGGIKLI